MKNIIFINGTMGAGKTATSNELKKMLPKAVFLDGDWCWDMSPFVVTEETKAMVLDNISYMLNNFIKCSEYENIIFCWVMHTDEIIKDIISKLDFSNARLHKFSLMLSKETLTKHIQGDIDKGIRTIDVLERSIDRLSMYEVMDTKKVNVDNISAKEAAEIILNFI